jgi:DNA mismatch repair protein MutS
MQIDKTTLSDISIFHSEEEQSIFRHLDFTTTIGGREFLRYLLAHPFSNLKKIEETQQTLRLIKEKLSDWPTTITNGTIMVVDKFFDTSIEDMPGRPNLISGFTYRLLNNPDYSLVKYSVEHFIDFTKGLKQIVQFFDKENVPPLLQAMIHKILLLINKPVIQNLIQWDKKKQLATIDVMHFGEFLRRHYKHEAFELVDIYSKLDAYYSLAYACQRHNYCFPQFEKTAHPYVDAKDLFHPLLSTPVSYTVQLNEQQNFLFLTGANMAGKSTFIKAIGVSVYLAHIGMGVPASNLKLSLFDGLLSNIQVEDNITKGESFFFNEVQRIKKTIEKINDGRNWLILIDELFKGTNVQDAMKCSIAVIEGLRKMNNALFILSTHLYEIGEGLRQFSNIQFRFFETSVEEDQLQFSYHLKEGISNDRLGYLIMKREGVVQMLENL